MLNTTNILVYWHPIISFIYMWFYSLFLWVKNIFKKQYLQPIEKQNDKDKASRLHAMIKPFILRRLKSQVATDLPEKVINVKYSTMNEDDADESSSCQQLHHQTHFFR